MRKDEHAAGARPHRKRVHRALALGVGQKEGGAPAVEILVQIDEKREARPPITVIHVVHVLPIPHPRAGPRAVNVRTVDETRRVSVDAEARVESGECADAAGGGGGQLGAGPRAAEKVRGKKRSTKRH